MHIPCDFRWSLQWRHNEREGVWNHQPHDCLLNRLFRRGSKKTSKLRVTGHREGNSTVPGEFPAQRANNAEMPPFDGAIMYRRVIYAFLLQTKPNSFTIRNELVQYIRFCRPQHHCHYVNIAMHVESGREWFRLRVIWFRFLSSTDDKMASYIMIDGIC